MIEKMKLVHIVARAGTRAEMLDSLRELGVLHLSEKAAPDEATAKKFETLSRLSSELKDYAPERPVQKQALSDSEFEQMYNNTLAALKEKSELSEKRIALQLAAERIKEWGDFNPDDVKFLLNKGVDFRFYRLDKKEFKKLNANNDVRFITLKSVEKMNTVAVIGGLPEGVSGNEFLLPEKGISQLQQEISGCNEKLKLCENTLKNSACHLENYKEQLIKAQNDVEYSAVNRTLGDESGLVWIYGYIPLADEQKFIDVAKQQNWAWQMEDAKESDAAVPTKIKYNKLTALIKPVFEILGTVPGYGEYDISFWFLAFFTLFFAMIIGDAGYGLLFLIGAVILSVKQKKVTNIGLLLFVLSGATVVWGSLTGTWFGLEGAMKIPFLKALVIPGFANYPQYFGVETATAQNSVMKFCFSIGFIQLALACIMNIRRKLIKKNLNWICDVGWLIAISALYFMVLFLVIGQKINIAAVGIAVGLGFLLVVLFGGMSPEKTFSQGLKAGLADTFTVFLNTISAFGNVMSYIRLFAVGMASLAIAQSFNNMASGFSGALVIAGAVIMVIGHILNIVMGFLSVVVHGVRLNLLEFSGQLGMEWSGTAYDPFRKLDNIKK